VPAGYALGATLNTWIDLTGLPLGIAGLSVLGGLLPVVGWWPPHRAGPRSGRTAAGRLPAPSDIL